MLQLVLTILDFGLLILAWLVQAIIYPSFQYINRESLPKWHANYQTLISFFVLPLMLAQLGLSVWLAVNISGYLTILHSCLLLLIWISTFFQAVPVHQNIEKQIEVEANLSNLVKVNTPRTILWTITFLISFILCLQNIHAISA